VRSTEISLQPGRVTCGSYTADTKTAGSCALLAQAALPCALFAAGPPAASSPGGAGSSSSSTSTSLRLLGGTDADLAPSASYLQEVLAPLLRERLGVQAAVEVAKRGFYPQGGGVLQLQVGGGGGGGGVG
jgi:RNA 3'-terminal phosphate cyclase (ATP)